MSQAPRRLCAVLMAAILSFAAVASAQTEVAEVQVAMAEARRHFDALEYEQALPLLDRAIAILSARPDAASRSLLAGAYELRAGVNFRINNQANARNDFVALLKVDAGYALTEGSPRVAALFEEARKATVTSVKLTVTPANAEVQLDGAAVAVAVDAPLRILIGDHTLTAKRLGYQPGTLTFTAVAGAAAEATLTLERSSAVIAVVTSPADTEVVVDGVSRGKTGVGPPPAEYVERAAGLGVPASALSSILLVSGLGTGPHRVEFRRPCFMLTERRMEVTELTDYIIDPVKLDPAVASLVVQSSQPATTVFIDGLDRGSAPYSAEVCEGAHTVDMRSPLGRFSKRIDARAGQKIEVVGTPRPAFALVSTFGQATLNTNLGLEIEKRLSPVQPIVVFAPAADKVDEALKADKLPLDWLAFDGTKLPLGKSSEVSPQLRRDLSVKLAKAFDAQGVASVSVPSSATPNRVVVSLLGAGSAEPDVIELSLDKQDTIANAVAQLDRALSFRRPTIGLATIDVADVVGAVVIGVDAGGSAALAGIKQGDLILKINDQAVNDSAGLVAALATRVADDKLSVEFKDRLGAPKRADLKVLMTPRLIAMNDQTLLVNRILVDLHSRLGSSPDPLDEPIVRLNLAAALLRLESWNEAQAELQKVTLPDGPGVSGGTVQYLLGLCADKLGSRSAAETAWKAAAASDGLLTEDGPPVKDLAEARLADLQRRPAGGQ